MSIAEKILDISSDIPIGADVRYSCPGFILLGKILEKHEKICYNGDRQISRTLYKRRIRMKRNIRIVALLLSFVMLFSLLISCGKDIDIDKGQANVTTTAATSGEAEKNYLFEIVYPSVSASELVIDLGNDDLEEFKAQLDAFKQTFGKGDGVSEDEFKAEMYELLSFKMKFQSQYGVAELLYYLDMSDSEVSEDYLEAYDLYNEAHDLFWGFYNEAKNDEDNPLSGVMREVIAKEFSGQLRTVGASSDEYNKQMMELEGEYNTIINSGATDSEIFEVYKKYLIAAEGYAKANYFENYYECAYEWSYYRRDTKEDREKLREYTRTYLVPLYKKLRANSKAFDAGLSSVEYNLSNKYLSGSYDSFAEDYLADYLSSLAESSYKAMSEAFEKDRVLIGDKAGAYNNALVHTVGNTPICYFHESKTTLDTVSHELGHYYAHVTADCTLYSYSLRETHSTANNMLFFSYLSSKLDGKAFKSVELYSVYNWMHQTILSVIKDEFDEILFTADPSKLELADLERIMSELIEKYGVSGIANSVESQLMTYWRRLGITYPMRNYSYAIANIASLQIYLLSKEDHNAAAEVFRKTVEETVNNGEYLATIEHAGLSSPYDEQTYITLNKLCELY